MQAGQLRIRSEAVCRLWLSSVYLAIIRAKQIRWWRKLARQTVIDHAQSSSHILINVR
jgi:hypothetical protein